MFTKEKQCVDTIKDVGNNNKINIPESSISKTLTQLCIGAHHQVDQY